MQKIELYNEERLGKIMECLLENSIKLFDEDEILAGHKGYNESWKNSRKILGKLAGMDGVHDIYSELEHDIPLIRDYAMEAAYIQGLKDGLSLMLFAASPSQTLTIFGENCRFAGMEGRNPNV